MCNKNSCNHTYHAIIVLLILSFLLLPNAPNFTPFLHKLTTKGGGGRSDGNGDGVVLSPPCTTTKLLLAFLYGSLFTLVLMIISNNSNSTPPKQDDPQPSSSSAGPYRTILYMGLTDEVDGPTQQVDGVGYALLRTFPTFAYSVRRPPKFGNGSKVCVICQHKFRDQELVRWLPDCDHLFHLSCIDEWLKSHRTCPCCRAELDYSTTNNHGTISSDAIYYDDFNEYYYNVF